MRTSDLVSLLKKYINTGEKIIDIGAGSCRISKELSKNSTVIPVDIKNYNKTNLDLVLYDGERIPFENNSFDVSLLVFVLHHSEDFMSSLREAVRVSTRIIIVEDTPKNIFERIFWRVFDWLLNAPHDLRPAMRAKSDKEWENVFMGLNLKLVTKENFRTAFPVFKLYQHTLFVLEK